MNKQELTALVADILQEMGTAVPAAAEVPEVGQVEDISALDLRELYLVPNARDEAAFRKLKARTPARLGLGRAGPRYRTLSMLRFRADHAAAQDAVFSQVSPEFPEKNGLVALQTRCRDKDEYLTRPDLGRCFDAENGEKARAAVPKAPRVLLVVGDGLSSAAITANAMDCLEAIRDGLKMRGIEAAPALFVHYCRVGAGDALGDVTGCELVCMLVGERPGLVTDKSMSAYITYRPRTGVSESSRTVVSNIHSQGTPAVEAGAHIAGLIETILKRQVSGVGLLREARS